MKRSIRSTCLAMAALALLLAGCGGGGNLELGGSIVGLTKSGLVLENRSNGSTQTIPANTINFVFDQQVNNDEDFDVEVKTQPTGAVCTPSFNKGRTASYSVLTIQITCVTNSYNLGGTVTGLDSAGLVIVNGSDTLTVAPGATSFTMPKKVADGLPYGLTILSQPQGRTCTIANGTGTMGSADITSVQVNCN